MRADRKMLGIWLGRNVTLKNDGNKLEIYVDDELAMIVPLEYGKGDMYPYIVRVRKNILKNICDGDEYVES